MRAIPRTAALLISLGLALALVGCAESDPLAAAIAERAAWDITVDRWLQSEAGQVTVNLKVTGPVHTTIETLTVRIELLDADGALISEDWRQLDVSGFNRGETKDVFVRLPAVEYSVEGLKLDQMVAPTPEQIGRIVELQLDEG